MSKTVRTWVISAMAILLAIVGIYNIMGADAEADHPHYQDESHNDND
ncbi:hypothetical protein [Halalkalibacter okhensis]|nr:hypothetical protein [Halalkalibacter okhensis]